MARREPRRYRHEGLEFGNLEFSSAAEQRYVREHIERVARKIRSAREAKGWSQEKLAEAAAISLSTIRFIERSQRAPSLPMLFKLLFILERDAQVWP
jgi:ribosome-binding protein aMBF1 (putative translation factor)